MKKYTITIEEKLVYNREVEIEIPDDMSESDLENHLDVCQGDGMLDDFFTGLKRKGIQVGSYDDDLSSPDSSEVECWEYNAVKD